MLDQDLFPICWIRHYSPYVCTLIRRLAPAAQFPSRRLFPTTRPTSCMSNTNRSSLAMSTLLHTRKRCSRTGTLVRIPGM
jgi:hypothetical protein